MTQPSRNKIQAAIVQVVVSHRQHAIARFLLRDLKKKISLMLSSCSIKCSRRLPFSRDPYRHSPSREGMHHNVKILALDWPTRYDHRAWETFLEFQEPL